jgi:hypothetical protein
VRESGNEITRYRRESDETANRATVEFEDKSLIISATDKDEARYYYYYCSIAMD